MALSAVLLCGAIGLLKGEADTKPLPPGEGAAPRVEAIPDAARAFVADHCVRCHNGDRKVANLDLTSPAYDPADAGNFALWVRVHDRVAAGAMPPEGAKQPDPAKRGAFVAGLAETFVASERRLLAGEGRSTQRRMNRLEYENALRDLLGVPMAQVAAQLPEDGEARRYNKSAGALDVSFLTMQRFVPPPTSPCARPSASSSTGRRRS